jgi:hypothetical protein
VASVIFAAMMPGIVGQNTLPKVNSPETSRDLGLSMPMLLGVITATLLAALIAALVGLWLEYRKARA